ncbi:unnamed protein product [Owenia fusiformis]|uniref:Angiotensin-converting enzyme n=1 Tax=Owenia fusiformis TaxID=6347 RepID=A0A8S4N250_OWEFU|nr:unnamed protein product [Owenia fusiformis]
MQAQNYSVFILMLLLLPFTHGLSQNRVARRVKMLLESGNELTFDDLNDMRSVQKRIVKRQADNNVNDIDLHSEPWCSTLADRLQDYSDKKKDNSNMISKASWSWQMKTYNMADILGAIAGNKNFTKWQNKFLNEIRNCTCEKEVTPDICRQRELILESTNLKPQNETLNSELNDLTTAMQAAYDGGKVDVSGKNLDFDDLIDVMGRSRDYDELARIWKDWRDQTGRQMRDIFPRTVELLNIAAREADYSDYGEFARKTYKDGDPDYDVVERVDALYGDICYLYKLLHLYAKFKLKAKYGNKYKDEDFRNDCIPAHILGEMYGLHWTNIYDILKISPDITGADVTEHLQENNFTAIKMARLAEEFFVRLGFDNMTEQFWNHSVFKRPTHINVSSSFCHASATNLFKDDYRLRMCTNVNSNDLFTIYHEMGHIAYFAAYKDQPYIYSEGANPGFHEAVGDTMSLLSSNPKMLNYSGFLGGKWKLQNETSKAWKELNINYLLFEALRRVVFLPYAYTVEKYMWDVYSGKIEPKDYNRAWVDYRMKYQGVCPPVVRSEKDWDAGAKIHVASMSPYIRYFFATILEFQFLDAICVGNGPLHKCNPFGKKVNRINRTMERFRNMLSLGRQKPWREALKSLRNAKRSKNEPLPDFNATQLTEFFEPLQAELETILTMNNIVTKIDLEGLKNNCRGWDTTYVMDTYFEGN